MKVKLVVTYGLLSAPEVSYCYLCRENMQNILMQMYFSKTDLKFILFFFFFLLDTIFVDLILRFCPGFHTTVAVFGRRSLPFEEVTVFDGAVFGRKIEIFEPIFFFSLSVFESHCIAVH